jgi:polyisoprenyl-phosphate glycosyltransferase
MVILIPIMNDWESFTYLVKRIDEVLSAEGLQAHLIAIDDGSSKQPEKILTDFQAVKKLDILRLRINIGHQRAIAIGLAYCSTNLPGQTVVVMDGDGEDGPEDIPRLYKAMETENSEKVIFAARSRRVESILFRFFYIIYKIAHWLLTSRRIQFGNFSIIPANRVHQLAVASELWNHYAATVVKSRIPYALVSTQRKERIAGQSKMNFVGLVIHGLSALSVFSDEVVTRILMLSCSIMALCVLASVGVLGVTYFTALTIPAWVMYVIAFMGIVFLQMMTLCFISCFFILGMRKQAVFIPERDYIYFISGIEEYPCMKSQASQSHDEEASFKPQN